MILPSYNPFDWFFYTHTQYTYRSIRTRGLATTVLNTTIAHSPAETPQYTPE